MPESDSKGCGSPDALSAPPTHQLYLNHPKQGIRQVLAFGRFSGHSVPQMPFQYEVNHKALESSHKPVGAHECGSSVELAWGITLVCEYGLSQGWFPQKPPGISLMPAGLMLIKHVFGNQRWAQAAWTVPRTKNQRLSPELPLCLCT